MIPISTIADDVILDNVNSAENGNLDYAMYNRLSRRAELRMMDFLSGDVEDIAPPAPYTSQKDKDWLSPFILPFTRQVKNGIITKPSDYYGYENMYLLGNGQSPDCDEDTEPEACNTPIELLDGPQFYTRCQTFIEGLRPSIKKPISKIIGNHFEFRPRDLGTVTLEYIRYPKFGKIVTKRDTFFNNEIPDEALSTNYEWDEYARELLIYFITDTFAIHTRETALKQQNQATQKLVRK